MNPEDMQQIEVSVEQCQEMIRKAEAVQRLQQHPDFREVITQGYMEHEAIRLVHAKSNAGLQSDAHQKSIDIDIRAIGSFADFLRNIMRQGQMAQQTLQADREELARGEAEQIEDDDAPPERMNGAAANISETVSGEANA